MDTEAELAKLITLGNNINSFKLYAISVTALFAYDYFLTLEDEVHYAWKTENFLIFVLFLFSRYLPPVFQTWLIITITFSGYTSEMYECDKTVSIPIVYYTFISAVAQIVLTQRTYAITKKNKWIAGILYTIAAAQFGIGIHTAVKAALKPAVVLPAPLDSYRLCLGNVEKVPTIIQMALSFIYDIAVLAAVIVEAQLMKSMRRGMNRSRIFDIVSRDAGIYFALITTSHLLTVAMHIAAKPGILFTPIVGNNMLIPMMICRTIISLKKVASLRPPHVSVEVSNGLSEDLQDIHTPLAAGGVQLSVFKH